MNNTKNVNLKPSQCAAVEQAVEAKGLEKARESSRPAVPSVAKVEPQSDNDDGSQDTRGGTGRGIGTR